MTLAHVGGFLVVEEYIRILLFQLVNVFCSKGYQVRVGLSGLTNNPPVQIGHAVEIQ